MKQKIMIVGSDSGFVEKAFMLLSAEGYDVKRCCAGNECIARVRNESPAMILFETASFAEEQCSSITRFLSDDASFKNIPVLVAVDGAENSLSFEPGECSSVRKVFSKSIDKDSLIKSVAQYMAQSGGEQHTMLVEDLQTIVDKWKDCKGNLIMILHAVQSKYGYVPRNVAFELSRMIDVSMAQIYEVITFYNFFKLEKPGTYKISLCMGTACYLKGAQDLLEELKRLLHVCEGETTSDGMFTLETVRCIGCCGLAPVLMINDKVYGKLKKENLPGILSQYVNKEPARQAV